MTLEEKQSAQVWGCSGLHLGSGNVFKEWFIIATIWIDLCLPQLGMSQYQILA